ncbi:hypothetical protein, partial [Paenibacillus polymyxa]|uniref:hypothetical protein n=1 Tax=Paenibacillus polymyxa TaxID=1406 RepID=UPI001E620BD5
SVYKRQTLDLDIPDDINKIKVIGSTVIPQIMKRLDVTGTQRIGVRAHFINTDYSSLSETASLIEKTFFGHGLREFLKQHTPSEPILNPTLTFHIKLNHEFNMAVNVAAHQLGTGRIDKDGNPQMLEVEKTQPLLDLDIYTTESKEASQINGVLKATLEFMNDYSVKIWSLGE